MFHVCNASYLCLPSLTFVFRKQHVCNLHPHINKIFLTLIFIKECCVTYIGSKVCKMKLTIHCTASSIFKCMVNTTCFQDLVTNLWYLGSSHKLRNKCLIFVAKHQVYLKQKTMIKFHFKNEIELWREHACDSKYISP